MNIQISSVNRLAGPEIRAENSIASVVLVHGIDGHYYQTWTSDVNKNSWLTEMQKLYPEISIYSISLPYKNISKSFSNEKLIEQLSFKALDDMFTQGIFDKPYMLLGHSLGGIFIKRIISDTTNHKNQRALIRRRSNLRSIAFVGVPHHGSPWAGNWLAFMLKNLRSETSKDLRPGGRILEDIHLRFQGSILAYRLCEMTSFHETEPIYHNATPKILTWPISLTMSFLGPVVPEKFSTIDNIPERNIRIKLCHLSIAKLDKLEAAPIKNCIFDFCSKITARFSEGSQGVSIT